VVFLGRALAEPVVRRGPEGRDDRVYRFAVEEPFAGVAGPTVEVVTGMGGGDCGLDFEVGRLTFVHAWHSRSGREIVVGLCGTTTTRDLSSPAVEYARARAAGGAEAAIFGRVTRGSPDEGGEGLDGVTISVEAPGGRELTATTGRDGRFDVPGPLAGLHVVRARVPGRAAPLPEQRLAIPAGGCAGVEFSVGEPADHP
jgi:hypothetical protein